VVIATQNPIENEGTYPLPESQLDRFLLKVSVGYPDREAELQILASHGERDLLDDIRPVISVAQVNGLAAAARTVHLAPSLQGYLVDLAHATRVHPHVSVGMSPRATLALQRVARARAATRNRTYVTPDDIKALAAPVLAHRLMLSPAARAAQATAESVIAEVLSQVPQPEARPVQSAG
jgi:MoxR-like ATPase